MAHTSSFRGRNDREERVLFKGDGGEIGGRGGGMDRETERGRQRGRERKERERDEGRGKEGERHKR